MWEAVINFFNYPLIDWWSAPVEAQEAIPATATADAIPAVEAIPSELIFQFSTVNIILIVVIYLVAKIFIKYIKRYFKAHQLTDRQLKIEGKEIAVWKLTRQLIYLIAFYIFFLTLKINNPHLNLGSIFAYEFFRIPNTEFHIAVYHLFLTVAIVVITRITLNFIKVLILRAGKKNERIDGGTQYIYIQLIKYLIYCTAAIILMRSFGMNLDLFLTASAFLLVGVGLGLQTIFRDYFSGILLLLEGTVKVGDVLEIETLNGHENFVAKMVQINLRTSKVETRDEKVLVIPNSKLTHESVINWSAGSRVTRFMIPITLHYGVDTDLVRKLLVECAESHAEVLKSRKPMVRLLNFGDNGLEMDLVFWAKQNLYIEILKSEIRFDIDRALREHGITIPYPQTDIHLNPRKGKTIEPNIPTQTDVYLNPRNAESIDPNIPPPTGAE
ncbi:MAG: mechanosensitive ion channel [Crocinitomix sp.]|nr:mechanosensitive ion channel [Crocinitomix sp.]